MNGYVIWVSTVWLGSDMAFGDGTPLIFETMAFDQTARAKRDAWYQEHGMVASPETDTWAHDQECDRWSTEQEALDGHWHVVEAIKAGTWHEDRED